MSLQESPLAGWRQEHAAWRRRYLVERFYDAFALTKRPAKKMRTIISRVAVKHGVSVDEIQSEDRTAPVAHARQEAYFCCRTEIRPVPSLTSIGRIFNRDHTTVIVGIRAHKARLAGEGKL